LELFEIRLTVRQTAAVDQEIETPSGKMQSSPVEVDVSISTEPGVSVPRSTLVEILESTAQQIRSSEAQTVTNNLPDIVAES